jgi:transposase
LCTHAKGESRELTLKRRAEHEALLAARERQTAAAWRAQYAVRAGIEGIPHARTRISRFAALRLRVASQLSRRRIRQQYPLLREPHDRKQES